MFLIMWTTRKNWSCSLARARLANGGNITGTFWNVQVVFWFIQWIRVIKLCFDQSPLYPSRITSHSVVEYNSSHELGLGMTMYSDDSFSYGYRDSIALHLSDVLFFEVALLTNNTFASEVLLEVISCWATESPDPQDETKGFFLLDGSVTVLGHIHLCTQKTRVCYWRSSGSLSCF